MLLSSYTIGLCLDPKGRPEKCEGVNSAKNHMTLARGPATVQLILDFVHQDSLRFVGLLQVPC